MRKKICIIEPDNQFRDQLREIFQAEDYQVEDHPNAYPLFDVNRSWPELFVIDIELSGINGLELCRWIKNQEETQFIPVVLLCGSPELEVLARDAKADACLLKPI